MYKGLSVSPLHGSFAAGFAPPASDLENLIAGRERKIGNFIDQAELERQLGGEVDLALSPLTEHFRGELSSLPQNVIDPRLIGHGGLQRRDQWDR